MDYWLEDEDIMYDDGDQSEGGRGPKWLGSADTLKHGERIVDRLNEQAAEIAALKAEDAELRRLLAFAHGVTYADDGELQDSSDFPFIDYKRDTAEALKAKIYQRGMNQLALSRMEDGLE